MVNEYLKKSEESITAYSIRLYRNRDAYGLTFQDCGNLLNEVSGEDYSEAKWRRPVQEFLKIQDYLEKENPAGLDSEQLQEIENEKIELQKEKIRMRDQKRELNAIIRRQARLEHLEDFLKETVESIEPVNFIKQDIEKKDKEVMVVLSDFHLGAVVESKHNQYNVKIAKERLSKLQRKTFETLKRDDANKLYISHIGDIIEGHINTTGRIESEENAIEQIIRACQYLEEFIEPFLQEGYEVLFTNTVGNHSRIVQNKKESLGTNENFERLLTVFLGKSFNKFDNYSQIDDEEGVVQLNIKGKEVFCVHADLDKGNNAVARLNNLFNTQLDYLIGGHVHNFFIKEHGKAVQFGAGSLMGVNSYAINSRFSGKPSQLILTFDSDGVDDVKPVYFN